MPIKRLILKLLTAFSALRAGKVFTVDTISVIASCQANADIIAGALKLLKDDPENYRHYQLVTENIGFVFVNLGIKKASVVNGCFFVSDISACD